MKESNNMTNAIEVIIYNSRVRGVPFFFIKMYMEEKDY